MRACFITPSICLHLLSVQNDPSQLWWWRDFEYVVVVVVGRNVHLEGYFLWVHVFFCMFFMCKPAVLPYHDEVTHKDGTYLFGVYGLDRFKPWGWPR